MKENLNSIPVTTLKGVGNSLACTLKKLNIETIEHLLFHLPLRYIDQTKLTLIANCNLNNVVVIQGYINQCQIISGRKQSLLCYLSDTSGSIGIRFYYSLAFHKKKLSNNNYIRCFGEIRTGSTGLEIYHPEYQIINPNSIPPLPHELTPIYPTTEGISQKKISLLCQIAINLMKEKPLTELIPIEIIKKFELIPLNEAILKLHKPNTKLNDMNKERKRLIFEELLAYHLAIQTLRMNINKYKAIAIDIQESEISSFIKQLPYQLTKAQHRVIKEIQQNIAKPIPMHRLIQGDVGSGKTIVAAISALCVVLNQCQVVLMAPTELLAEQHYSNFKSWFGFLGIQISFLSGKLNGKKREKILTDIRESKAKIIIGTHALFQKDVYFNKLALIIIDEQHRFGVDQRLALRKKGESYGKLPHQLMMTATPIPRTLAMSIYSDLDCSIIDELPKNRIPINTVVISNQQRDQVINRLKIACSLGKQAYWVCTLIDKSEILECEAAEETLISIQSALPMLNVKLIHGRMKSEEKNKIMDLFQAGLIDILIATTVIEVGVDVPNASLMIIENPERLGLAQLHQLRGRIGRGTIASHCLLLYQYPLSKHGFKRLNVIRESNDGFYIAEQDLNIRGPGEFLGTIQTGLPKMKIADLIEDKNMLNDIHTAGDMILKKYNNVATLLIKRWLQTSKEYNTV